MMIPARRFRCMYDVAKIIFSLFVDDNVSCCLLLYLVIALFCYDYILAKLVCYDRESFRTKKRDVM